MRTMTPRIGLLLTVLLAALAAPAQAHHPPPTASLRATALSAQGACTGGAPTTPTRVITGTFSEAQKGQYMMLPFDVPAGTTSVRVKYCYDQPENAVLPMARHTLDLGLWEARPGPGEPWGEEQFRGWGGSSHPDVIVTPQGFSSEEAYLADRKGNVPGRTTRGFRPGPIPGGEWAVELDVAGVVGPLLGDADGTVAWRVEIELSDDPAFAADPYVPAPYDAGPVRPGAGWYAGDMHVHGEHSALGDATMTELFGFAFAPLGQGAGLDFVTLSDYVAGSSWGEVGRFQPRYPDKLIVRSSEVITLRGHLNNHDTTRFIDHRTGPVFERRADGSMTQLRGPRPARELFDDIHEAGGFTQINHPTIFPSQVPLFELFCRGCPWDYSAAETDYGKVDAIEVSTGPGGLQDPVELGPNPFTPLAIEFYERALRTGARIAAVGVSDSHNAGRRNDPLTQAPIGQATTVVYADELSPAGLARAVRARHTYVKLFGNDGPDLRFEATTPGMDGPPAIMGDIVRAGAAHLTARVIGGGPDRQLLVLKDGLPIGAYVVDSADFRRTFPTLGPGRYRLQLMRGTTIEALTSPIWVDPNAGPDADRPDAAFNTVRAVTGRRLRVRGTRVSVPCRAAGYGVRRCTVRLRARPGGRRITTIGRATKALRGGEATVRVRLNRAGRALLRRRPAGFAATVEATASGAHGTVGPDRRRTRLARR